MNADPFYIFFGIFGLVIGAGVVWFLLAEHPFERPEVRGGPIDELEVPLLAKLMAEDGRPLDEESIARLIHLHQAYFDGRISDMVSAAEDARMTAEMERLAKEQEAEHVGEIQDMARRDVV
jgi:hypothetical protein